MSAWSGSLSSCSVPARSSGTWAGHRETAAPSSSPPAGSLCGRPPGPGPPVWPGRSRPCPPTRPHTDTVTDSRATAPGLWALKAWSSENVSPPAVTHPTGPEAAAARGEGAVFGVCGANHPGPETEQAARSRLCVRTRLVSGQCDVVNRRYRVIPPAGPSGATQRCCPAESALRPACLSELPASLASEQPTDRVYSFLKTLRGAPEAVTSGFKPVRRRLLTAVRSSTTPRSESLCPETAVPPSGAARSRAA